MNKSITVLLAILFFGSCSRQDGNIIRIHFTGMEFDSLNLEFIMDDENHSKVTVPGISDNAKDWIFTYNDSIWDHQQYVNLRLPSRLDTLVESIGFLRVDGADTLLGGSLFFDRDNSEVWAEYETTKLSFGDLYRDSETGLVKAKTSKQYRFMVETEDRQLLSIIDGIGYRYGFPNPRDPEEYVKAMEQYEKLTLKYPDSRYLSTILSGTMVLFPSKDDVRRLYDCFSEQVRQSPNGIKIREYLDYEAFENSFLPVWNTGQTEAIVKDTTLYNLVLFSASWCAPCLEEIPMLKELYRDYGDRLVMTYVSMDEEETLNGWTTLMNKEAIPWRSLMAKDSLNVMRDRYFVQGIPHTLLVYPGGGKAEVMDIRLVVKYNKLVSLLQQS